jgi:molybdopterin molybdotransferase
MSMDEALALLLADAVPVREVETVDLAGALGRVLAAPLSSRIDVPPWDNSAMDGYAVCCRDLAAEETCLPVSQRIAAGATAEPLRPGTAARIFTGAPVPPGADAVVVQEGCRRDGDRVILRGVPVAPGAHIRRAGEDIRRGSQVIPAGTRLRPQHLGLAASVGVDRLAVYRRLRVAVLSSGDELAMPGEPLRPGQIYNSNEVTLGALVHALGGEPEALGVVEDSLDATVEALARGAAGADLILTTGGVSVGEEDHVKAAVERLGRLALWRIAIRPGKPLAYGRVGGTPVIGTPGNPVSMFVTFCLFARPFILRAQGVGDVTVPALSARAGFDWPRPDPRREFVRARLELGADGVPTVGVYPSRSSGVLSSVAWANGLAVIPEGQVLRRGDPVRFLSFSELLT